MRFSFEVSRVPLHVTIARGIPSLIPRRCGVCFELAMSNGLRQDVMDLIFDSQLPVFVRDQRSIRTITNQPKDFGNV